MGSSQCFLLVDSWVVQIKGTLYIYDNNLFIKTNISSNKIWIAGKRHPKVQRESSSVEYGS